MEEIKSAIAYDDGFTGLHTRIGAFFEENNDTDARADYLRRTYGFSSVSWDISTAPKTIITSDSGMHLQLPGIDRRLSWEQAETILDRMYSEHTPDTIEEKETVTVTFKSLQDVFIPAQTSLFGAETTVSADEAYLRERLLDSVPYASSKNDIYNAVTSASSGREAAKAIKKIYGWFGRTATFSDGKRGWVNFSPKGAELIIYGSEGTDSHKAVFTWNRVGKTLRELVEAGLFVPEQEKTDPQSTAQDTGTQAPPPTLKDLLARPDTVGACLIKDGIAQIATVEKAPMVLSELYGVNTRRIPFGETPDAYLLHDGSWMDKRLPANIWADDNRILFGDVSIVKVTDNMPVEPEPEEVESWWQWAARAARPFTSTEIAREMAQAAEGGQMSNLIDPETFRLADSLNRYNRVRVLLVEPGKAPAEMVIENSGISFQQYIGGTAEYGVLEDGVDYIAQAGRPWTL